MCPINRPWKIAESHYTEEDDGLNKNWFGFVWCNPPYGNEMNRWLEKLSDHGDGIALIFARTETKMFFNQVWEEADSLLFIEGRLYFHQPNGERAENNSGAPSVLAGYGKEATNRLSSCSIPGAFVSNWIVENRQQKSWSKVGCLKKHNNE